MCCVVWSGGGGAYTQVGQWVNGVKEKGTGVGSKQANLGGIEANGWWSGTAGTDWV